MREATRGLGLCLRLALRGGRWFWAAWVAVLALLLPATVSAYRTTIPEGPRGEAMAAALGANPTMRAMLGPPYDLLTAGGFAMWRVGTFVAAAAAMMTALGVVRATRAEEESGRLELLRAGAIGRHAPLAAGVLAAGAMSLLLGICITSSLTAQAPPASGAVATGLGIALTGLVWAGVGALAAQLSASARTCRAVALGALGVAYVVRAVADVVPEPSAWTSLRWASPVEWAALVRPYAGERWWVLVLPALLTVVLVAVAVRLESRRDIGAGLWPPRPGPAHAAPGLHDAAGLARRLLRGGILGWSIALPAFALVIGALAGTVDDLLSDNPGAAALFRRMGAGAPELRQAFLVAMLEIVSVLLALLTVQLLARLRAEEEAGRAETMLATATSRVAYALAFAGPAIVVPTALFVACGALVAVPTAIAGRSLEPCLTFAGTALALAPGLWLVAGLTLLVLGAAPRLLPVAWALVAWTVVAGWAGPLLGLPDAVVRATPFARLPHPPAQPFSWPPELIAVAVAAALLAAGLAAYRRRDVG